MARARAGQVLIGCIRPFRLVGFLCLVACASNDRPPRLNDTDEGATGGRSTGGAGAAGATSTSTGQGGSANAGIGGASGAAGISGGGGEPLTESCIPRQGCQRLCDVLGVEPACGLGNVSQCGCACEERFNGPCPDELDALLTCTGDSPTIDCRVRGRIFPGCENESFALEVCDFRAREQLCAGSYPACTPYCRAAMLSFCPLGPESVASCLCGCEASLVTTCTTEFDAFMTCSGAAPAFTCDPDGRLLASSCGTEWQTLSACMTAAPE
jgi:hypothetical protein